MVNTMKKLICVMIILAFSVTLLCGCNSEGDKKAEKNDTTVSHSETLSEETKATEDKENSFEKSDDNESDSDKDAEENSAYKAENKAENGDSDKNNEKETVEDNTDEYHEVEIDFSELE